MKSVQSAKCRVKNYEEMYERILNESEEMKKENCDLKVRIYSINCSCVKAMEELGVPVPQQYKRMSDKLREIPVLCDIKYDDIPY